MRKRRAAFAVSLRHRSDRVAHNLAGILSVFQQYGDDLIDCDGIVMRMPAIIVRNHGHGDVTDLGFTGQFGFLQVGHANHVHAPTAVNIGFRFGRELRPFHAQISSPALPGDRGRLAGCFNDLSELWTDRIGKRNVSYDAIPEESIHAMTSAVEELIGNYEVQWLMFFLQRTDRGHGDDPFHAELFEAINVGAKIQFSGENAMAASVARQKCNFAAFECAQDVSIRGFAEWSVLSKFLYAGKARHRIDPAAADNANFCLRQKSPRTTTRSVEFGLYKKSSAAIESSQERCRVLGAAAFPRGRPRDADQDHGFI